MRFDNSEHPTIAAVDLGSNSFHLVVAQVEHQRLFVIDKIKEMVRLAAGLDDRSILSENAIERALRCLERFGQRLRHIPSENVRIVGTNTLRKARNRDEFLARARLAVGHEIEIISGREEARLIYLGVSHSLEDTAERRLVVDIGGGSTELIVGRRFAPAVTESLYVGSVEFTKEFFPNGRIRSQAFGAARLTTQQELEPVQQSFINHGWDTVIGASGSILAVRDVLIAMNLSSELISATALNHLSAEVLKVRNTDELVLPGLPRQRQDIFPAGVAILSGIFSTFAIKTLRVSDGALREGLLAEILGRSQREDVRDDTVADLARRYHVDLRHAARVRNTANYLLEALALDTTEHHRQLLNWAATLHEIGLDIAHNQYHKHGAYLLQHMDMPGFSRAEQQQLAFLVRAHRRKFPIERIALSPTKQTAEFNLLAVLLRIAVVLHRNRSDEPPPIFQAFRVDLGISLRFPRDFLKTHPLTALDLTEEANFLRAAGIPLQFTDDQLTQAARELWR